MLGFAVVVVVVVRADRGIAHFGPGSQRHLHHNWARSFKMSGPSPSPPSVLCPDGEC